MTEYIQITIDPYINGDGLRIYSNLEKVVNETHEERLEALRVVERWVQDRIIEELERRHQNAAHA